MDVKSVTLVSSETRETICREVDLLGWRLALRTLTGSREASQTAITEAGLRPSSLSVEKRRGRKENLIR